MSLLKIWLFKCSLADNLWNVCIRWGILGMTGRDADRNGKLEHDYLEHCFSVVCEENLVKVIR